MAAILGAEGGRLVGPDLREARADTTTATISLEARGPSQRQIVRCAINTLGKGSLTAAVQCMNLMLGLGESVGLRTAPSPSVEDDLSNEVAR